LDNAKGDDAEAENGKACVVNVVMTGSADNGPEWQKHIGNKKQRRDLANQLTHQPPHGGFALRAAYRQSVSPPASRLGSSTRRTRSRS